MKRLLYSWGVVTGLLVVGGCTSSESPVVPAAATADVPGPDVTGVAGTGPVPAKEKRAKADSSIPAAAAAAATSEAPPAAEPELAKAAAPIAANSDTPTVASAESILDAAIESLGEAAAVARVKKIKRTGTVHVEGEFGAFDGTTERVAVVGAQARSVMNLGDAYEQTLGWNGQTAWSNDTQAGVQDAQPYQSVQLRMAAAVSPLLPLRGGGIRCDRVAGSARIRRADL